MSLASFMPYGFHEETLKIRKVNSTACASNKNKTFHRQAFITTHRLSIDLLLMCDLLPLCSTVMDLIKNVPACIFNSRLLSLQLEAKDEHFLNATDISLIDFSCTLCCLPMEAPVILVLTQLLNAAHYLSYSTKSPSKCYNNLTIWLSILDNLRSISPFSWMWLFACIQFSSTKFVT